MMTGPIRKMISEPRNSRRRVAHSPASVYVRAIVPHRWGASTSGPYRYTITAITETVRPATCSVHAGSSAVGPPPRVAYSTATSPKPSQNGNRFHTKSVRGVHNQDQRTRGTRASEVVAVMRWLPQPSLGGTSIDNYLP